MAPGGGKRGGRGRGDGGGGRQGPGGAGNGGGGGNMEARRSGGGRGIPEFKENPSTRRAPTSSGEGEGDATNTSQVSEASPSSPVAAQKFNAQEAAEWLASRYQAVIDEYDKQKQSGKKGDIQKVSDLNSERSAWSGGSNPVIAPSEDFLHQLQVALLPFRQRGAVGDQKGTAGA
eukprot:CAMPEP_0176265712 /NCGR_PEP_ID=MMETSP0121_2-20121125/42280_1 /TAXON_ID=160619 /ORGANISM="Kryptoperidinium foliaceum, Strain CCMP 1326" /LENGTH=174 /DNA_ID=CAMNT_0017605743 /DNA_START=78 /DNA_END=602 /DNA_ORIENTATION=-